MGRVHGDSVFNVYRNKTSHNLLEDLAVT